MESIIKSVEFIKEWENTKFNTTMYSFRVKYDDKTAFYNSKSRDQKKFVEGQKAEFTEETRTGKEGKKYLVVKPVYNRPGNSNYAKALTREQSRYSGFAMAYAKDLLVAGKIETIEAMYAEAQNMIDWMVAADKELKS